MSTAIPMEKIGSLPDGRDLYYADEHFEKPGFYVWDAEVGNHVRMEFVRADQERRKDDNLNPAEARLPLRINGIKAAELIKRAYGLGDELSGVGRYDLSDPVQTELRHIKGWIEMAERDALDARSSK